uniref:ABC transporter domain-containing protein n=1 Tax=Mycena chlorophos TaxID=658473 RepID=A0ABQ0KVZ4_MYCCL|nr:predicted protein [Mycena chlorophos]
MCRIYRTLDTFSEDSTHFGNVSILRMCRCVEISTSSFSSVGRTGSGKSSLTLSLLRCIPTDGTVYYDGHGLDTANLNLDALRTSITIIPQVPELLSGTLRSNLEPFGEHDDAELRDRHRTVYGYDRMFTVKYGGV